MSLFLAGLARDARILIVGDAMLDRYVSGDVTRVSPEAPVPVLLARRDTYRAGGAANVAANVAALGGRCELLAVIGNDAAGLNLMSLLQDAGISPTIVVDPDGSTTEKTRLVSGTHQIARIDRDGTVGAAALSDIRARFETAVHEADLIVFSDYGKGALADLPSLIARARSLGKPSLVDPKLADPEQYRGSFMLKPNAGEFQALFGPCVEADLVDRARKVLQRYEIEHLVLTRGPRGMLLVSADGTVIEHPTDAIEVFDVSGAGDTVIATLAVAIAAGASLDRALHLSNVAAGIAVSHAGTYVVTSHDMESRLAQEHAGRSKVLPPDTLSPLLQSHRAKGEPLVFTNGCFDILHPGHVRMLRAAKAEGDLLVVGLNGDESVRRLKGPTRPVNTFEDRAEVLAGLDCVDFVVAFDEDTPLELIRALQPDVLVKGGDYDAESIVGYNVVAERGGRVVIVDYYAGHSTTRLIAKASGAKPAE